MDGKKRGNENDKKRAEVLEEAQRMAFGTSRENAIHTMYEELTLDMAHDLRDAVTQISGRIDRQEEASERHRMGMAVYEVLQLALGTLVLIGVAVSIWVAVATA